MSKYKVIDSKGNVVNEFEVKENEWPEEGDMYWIVEETGSVVGITWVNDDIDEDLKDFGNIFRTEEEALIARDKIHEFLVSLKK